MFRYLKKYWLFALLAPLFMVGEVFMDLLQPRLMSTIVDEGVLGLSNNGVGDLNLVLTTGIKMIGFVLLGGLCGIMSGVFANMCSQNFGNDVRKDCFSKVMQLSFEQTDRFSTGSLITRVTNDITQVQNMVGMCIRGFVRNIIMFFGGIFCMVQLHISFGKVVIIALPLVIAMVIFFIGKANPLYSVLQKKLDRVNSVMQENVSGTRVVKAYVRENYEKERFKKANEGLIETQLRVLVLFSYMTPILNIILNVSVVAVIYIGGIEVKAGSITPGEIMAAITYISQILHGIMMMSMTFQNISRGSASAKRLNEVINCEPVIKDGNFGGYKMDEKPGQEGRIEFKNVSFAYPQGNGREVLRDINLTIEPGETLGILGATGSGKSSLVNLIPRFYDATTGEVFVDGVNVKEYELTALRDKVAIALQKSELFHATIEENIKWGNGEATKEEIRIATDTSCASEFIDASKEGYDTLVAENGMSLSGGQKQRLSISRAVLKAAKGAKILIFDDTTSALDLKTEAKLYQELNARYDHLTKVIIAQRIASVKDADRIAVIDEGTIVACASHEVLMETCEIYQDIYNSQLKNHKEANKEEWRNE